MGWYSDDIIHLAIAHGVTNNIQRDERLRFIQKINRFEAFTFKHR